MKNNKNISFLSLSKEIEIPTLEEIKIKNKEYVGYGRDNQFPNFLLDLYDNCGEHQAIIDSAVNYVMGNGLIITDDKLKSFSEKVNADYEKLSDIMRKSELDYQIFGGFALKVMLNKFGEIIELYSIPFDCLRINETETKVYFSKNFGKWGAEAIEYSIYDRFNPKTNSIYYYKGKKTRKIYPIPLYNAGIKAILTSTKIDTFHLNNIDTNFTTSAIINFNNGNPTEEDKEEFEKQIKNKFTGTDAQKFLISYNENQESAVTIDRLESDNYDEKYEQLRKSTENKIFVAHKVTSPSLFGILPDNQGFSSQEFVESFTIYNKTTIKPLQMDLILEFEKVLDSTFPNAKIEIDPFSINDLNNDKNNGNDL